MRGFDYDWLVVGSGFGGSVCALRLAEKGYRVGLLEQGRRFADHEHASSAWQLRRVIWAPRLGLRGILQITPFRHVTVLSGVGVGGGSLVYGNTLYRPRSAALYEHPQWAELADWRAELDPHFAAVEQMLGATEYEGEGPSERVMRALARELGVAETVRATTVGVFFGEPGKLVADPYLGGRGPARTGCVRCGQCMLGCRYGAKNTLLKNYLHLAEAHGVEIHSERQVTAIRPRGHEDGSDGYLVRVRGPRLTERSLAARGLAVCAGTLGTNRLLRRSKDAGLLPRISERLGQRVRTNSEAIVAATAADGDYRAGVAITTSIYPDEETHVTNNTYGAGADALALSFGPLTAGSRRAPRAADCLKAIARAPGRWLGPRRIAGWSRRTVILTVMRSDDTELELRPLWRGGALQTAAAGSPPRAYLPVANHLASLAARLMHGTAQSSLAESLRGAPVTAHFLGGAVIGADADSGVVDAGHRVFGYRNLLVCDGAAVPVNVGVNPSLTIAALAERAMRQIPDSA